MRGAPDGGSTAAKCFTRHKASILGHELCNHEEAVPRPDSNLGAVSAAEASSDKITAVDGKSLRVVGLIVVGFLQRAEELFQFCHLCVARVFAVSGLSGVFHRHFA